MSSETLDINLKMVGLELMFLTPEKCSSTDGITAVELAKLVNLPVDEVKKKLNLLKENEKPITEFDEGLFHSLIDNVKVMSEKKLVFCFKDGTEIDRDI